MDFRFTGIKDLDLLTLSYLKDEDLLNMCLVNKYVNNLCKDENFWRNRTQNKFKYASEVKNPDKSWRNYYLQLISISSKNNIEELSSELIAASKRGDLDIVKYLLSIKKFPWRALNQSLGYAAAFGKLDIVKVLHEKGANIQDTDDFALKWAASNGHLDTVKYLVENHANISAENNFALKAATKNGHFKITKYLVNILEA